MDADFEDDLRMSFYIAITCGSIALAGIAYVLWILFRIVFL